jgi:hypothetical protein
LRRVAATAVDPRATAKVLCVRSACVIRGGVWSGAEGVTDLEGRERGPVPARFVAVAVNVTGLPFGRPVTDRDGP